MAHKVNKSYLWSFLISYILHLAMFLYLASKNEKTPEKHKSSVANVEIKPSIKFKPAPSHHKEISVPMEVGTSLSSRTPVAKYQPMATSQEQSIGKIYRNLLPTQGDFRFQKTAESESLKPLGGSSIPGTNSGPYHGADYQNLMIDAKALLGLFDVPLFIREIFESGRANLAFDILDEQRIHIHTLSGDPYLRAIIWEALHSQTAKVSLRNLSGIMGQNAISIEVQYFSRLSVDGRESRFEEQITVEEDRISLALILNKDRRFGPPPQGFDLPDEHAERAKINDRARVKKFRLSIAFRRIIRDEVIY